MPTLRVRAYQVRLYLGDILVKQVLYTNDTLYAYTLNTFLEKGVSLADSLYHRIDRMEVNVIQLPSDCLNDSDGLPIATACTSVVKVN